MVGYLHVRPWVPTPGEEGEGGMGREEGRGKGREGGGREPCVFGMGRVLWSAPHAPSFNMLAMAQFIHTLLCLPGLSRKADWGPLLGLGSLSSGLPGKVQSLPLSLLAFL